jgi:predicted DNA repair protein MutK
VVILIFILPLSIYFPSLIGPVLILWGLYLSFEGAEKIYEYFYWIVTKTNHIEHVIELTEKQKIKSAILTDFILSIEIIVITLASVVEEPMLVKIIVVTFVSFLASVWVYWLVAGLVKIDDLGFYIKNKSIIWTIKYKFWNFLIALLPQLIKALMIIWTLAMLLVAGWIFTHNIEVLHHFYDNNFSFLYLFLFDMTISLIVGLILFSIFKLVQKFLKK